MMREPTKERQQQSTLPTCEQMGEREEGIRRYRGRVENSGGVKIPHAF